MSSPFPTRVGLLVVLLVTGTGLAVLETSARDGTIGRATAGGILWLTTGLFALRVAGQVLVALEAPSWLPPMRDWNLTPYRLLLPTQIVILGAMACVDISVHPGGGFEQRGALGRSLIGFSAVYVAAMAVRYAVRMWRRPAERWFGGTIPIVFHVVLALYVFTLGSHLAAR